MSKAPAVEPLLGRTIPRIYTPPLITGRPGPCGCGCALTPKTSLGFSCIEFADQILGITLFPWQRWLLIHALELRPDGMLRYRTVLVLVARQNGKSTLMIVLALWVMYILGRPLVIGTAQNLDTAEEVWEHAVEIAQGVDELADEVEQVSKVNGKKFLKLKTGERYKVAAASRRGGRGLSGDLVLLDELREHQSWDAWAAVTKTTLAREAAQVWGVSNAGDAASIVLRWLRKIAHVPLGDPDNLSELDEVTWEEDEDELGDDTLGIFEWSALPGCAVMDRDGWAQANPSLGYGITERALRSAARNDPEHIFRIECLCQWLDTTTDGPFPAGSWEACLDPDSAIATEARLAFCVDVAWDRSMTHIGVAGHRDDGTPHVEIIASQPGTDWVPGWFSARATRLEVPVALQGSGAPATSLIQPLKDLDIDVREWTGVDLQKGTGDLYDRVRRAVAADPTGPDTRSEEEDPEPGLRHRGQPVLDTAAKNAATRPSGDAWLWDRKRSPVDIAPLVAVTGALWLLNTYEETEVPELW